MSAERTSDVADVLAERAQALAAPRARTGDERGLPHLVARVGTTRFGLPVERAAHVVARSPITSVPGSGAGILGIAVVLGGLLPVADAALVLGLDPDATAPGRIVVLTDGDERIGLLVDAVDGLERVEPGAPPPPDAGRAETRLLQPNPTADWFVLDVDALLDDRRLSPIDHPQTTAGQGDP